MNSPSHQEPDGEDQAWIDFQTLHTRDCAALAVRSDALMFLLAVPEIPILLTAWLTTLGQPSDTTIGAIHLALTIVVFSTLSVVRKFGIGSPAWEFSCCVAHNGLMIACLLAIFCWRVTRMPNEIMMHKAFVSLYLVTLAGSIFCYYVPLKWHIVFVTIPAGLSWLCFHWAVGFLTPTSASWALIWPLVEIFFFRHIESCEWARYQSVRRNEEMRVLSEAWEKALRNMLSSVFDATCECDELGKVLSTSAHFQDLMGKGDESIVGSYLSELASSPSEASRIATFLEHYFVYRSQHRESCPAAKLETALEHQASGNEVALSLSCVLVPLRGDRHAVRLLIGWQRAQCDRDTAYSTGGCRASDEQFEFNTLPVDASLKTSKDSSGDTSMFSAPDRCGFDGQCFEEGSKQLRECAAPRAGCDFETSSSLSYSNLTSSAPCGERENSSASASMPTELPPHLRSPGIFCDASTQTDIPLGTLRPPQLPQDALPRRVSFRSSKALHRQFKATPVNTIKALLIELFEKLNPSGRACCSMHMCLASLSFVLKGMSADKCAPALELKRPWQCPFCFVINSQDSDSDGEDDDEQRQCCLCGTASHTSSSSSCLADASCSQVSSVGDLS